MRLIFLAYLTLNNLYVQNMKIKATPKASRRSKRVSEKKRSSERVQGQVKTVSIPVILAYTFDIGQLWCIYQSYSLHVCSNCIV